MKAATSEEEHFSLSAYMPHSWPLWPQTLHGSRATLRPVSRPRLYSSSPFTHLTGIMEQNSAWCDSKPSAEVNRYPPGSHLRPAGPNSGPQTDLRRVYKPQHLNLLLEKWSKAFIRFSKVSLIQKRLHPLSEKGNNNKSLNSELLGTKLNSEVLRYRPYLHHCISCT